MRLRRKLDLGGGVDSVAPETKGRMNPDGQREHLGFEILLSPDDVVKILGLEKPEQVYELIRAQARSPLPYIRVGKYLRFKPSAVQQWLDENRSAPRARHAQNLRKAHRMEARK